MAKRHRHSSLERSRQIADILARHGLGYLVGVFGLERVIPFQRGLLKHPRRATPYTKPEHLRMAFEELGTTFIKFGQILSTRSDLLSVEYEAEFVKLQDAAPAIAFDEVQETLVAELGKPIQEIFATFDASPLAIASIRSALMVYSSATHQKSLSSHSGSRVML